MHERCGPVTSQTLETTIYSLSEDTPRPTARPERRGGERHMTLYRVGSITIGDRRELCLIKNISAGGMMIRAYSSLSAGAEVEIELKSGQPIGGIVNWVRDENAGVTFDAPIDVIDILSVSMDGPRPRMPRIEVDCMATLREGANILRLKVCDISQGGVKLECSSTLPIDADAVVTLPGIQAHAGSIRWCSDRHVGITFNRLLPLVDLVQWLRQQRESAAPDPAINRPG